MSGISMIIQFLLLVGWYVVPAMAALPVWLVFLPLILTAIVLAFALLVAVVAAVKA